MASPKIVVFSIFDITTGAPVTGATPTWTTYKDDTGANLAQPSFVEIGGGLYYFTPVFTTNRGIAYILDTGGASNTPDKYSGYLRPEDFYVDDILDLKDEAFGKWQIFTSGPDANRLVLYRADGVTVLKKFDLADAAGAATSINPYRKTPV